MATPSIDRIDFSATQSRLLAIYSDPTAKHVEPGQSTWEVSAKLQAVYAARGREQWLYGEVLGLAELLRALLAVPARMGNPEDVRSRRIPVPVALSCGRTFALRARRCRHVTCVRVSPSQLVLDIGSGTGRFVAFAALAGFCACGQEFVPERHAEAVAARARCTPAERERIDLRCEDALATTSPLDRATRVFCNNAVWPDHLNAQVAAHVAASAPHLACFAVMKELSSEAARANDLVLTRRTAVEVSWDKTGWPLFVYEPRAARPNPLVEPMDDEAFQAALESSTGFSMF